MTSDTITMTTPPRPARRDAAPPRGRPWVPHTVHLRELTMPDGRKVLVDRRFVGFVCQGRPEEFDGKSVCVVAFKGWAKPIPVSEGYYDLKSWWRGDKAASAARAGDSHGSGAD